MGLAESPGGGGGPADRNPSFACLLPGGLPRRRAEGEVTHRSRRGLTRPNKVGLRKRTFFSSDLLSGSKPGRRARTVRRSIDAFYTCFLC
ncbi:protein of unknown function [Methylacidimicrobium sp. AP8]|nr:protein of unknown function [Methylacidimicrobium sp. AP8]